MKLIVRVNYTSLMQFQQPSSVHFSPTLITPALVDFIIRYQSDNTP